MSSPIDKHCEKCGVRVPLPKAPEEVRFRAIFGTLCNSCKEKDEKTS